MSNMLYMAFTGHEPLNYTLTCYPVIYYILFYYHAEQNNTIKSKYCTENNRNWNI